MNSILANLKEQIERWQRRVGIDDDCMMSSVRSAHKTSQLEKNSDQAEPRGFLTILGSNWITNTKLKSSPRYVHDEFPDGLHRPELFRHPGDVEKNIPIYDTSYYIVFERCDTL